MAKERMNNLFIEHARLIFKNFSGASKKFNPPGNRNFHVILDPETADRLQAEGWNVKVHSPRDEYTEPLYTLPVKVSYKYYPPKIVLVTSNGKTILDESEIHMLDFAQFVNVDLMISPYSYDFNGNSGVTAYLKSMYYSIYEDELEKKYSNIPDTGINSIVPNEV